MEDAATICAYIGAAFSIITYICVVYSTFKLKTDEKRQKYVATAVCIVNLMPPIISLLYEHHLKWWEITVNVCCISAYGLNLTTEVWNSKSMGYGLLVAFVLVVEIAETYRYLIHMNVEIRRLWYCAILSFGTVMVPAIFCFIFKWRFSYMDTHVTLIATTAVLLQFFSLIAHATEETRAQE